MACLWQRILLPAGERRGTLREVERSRSPDQRAVDGWAVDSLGSGSSEPSTAELLTVDVLDLLDEEEVGGGLEAVAALAGAEDLVAAWAEEAAEAHDVGEERRVVPQRVVLDGPDAADDFLLGEAPPRRAGEEEEELLQAGCAGGGRRRSRPCGGPPRAWRRCRARGARRRGDWGPGGSTSVACPSATMKR